MNWEFRVQEPTKNGTCDVNVVLTATLTDEEISRMTRCDDEYVAQRWWPVEKILRARDDGEVGERVLRPIRNATRRMVFVKTENAMYEAVRRGGDDAEATSSRGLARGCYKTDGVSMFRCVREGRRARVWVRDARGDAAGSLRGGARGGGALSHEVSVPARSTASVNKPCV